MWRRGIFTYTSTCIFVSILIVHCEVTFMNIETFKNTHVGDFLTGSKETVFK